MSDEELAGLICAVAERRDREAFAALFRHYAPRLRAYCRRSGADEAAADEVAQEAMVALWRNAAQYDPARAGPNSWVYTIVRNKRIDLIRRERRPEPLPGQDGTAADGAADGADPAPDAVTVIAAREDSAQLHEGLRALPEEQAAVLRMAYFEDRPHREISAALGLPLGTVKSRIRLALGRLRGALAEAGR